MLDKIIYAGGVFIGFLAIMNPISSISIFLTLTEGEDEAGSRKIAKQSVLTALGIVFVFALAGQFLLNLFGISFTAMRLAGGILVGLIGYEMLQGKQSMISSPSKSTIEKTIKEEGSVALTPLGTPLLAGPGVIITAMNFSAGNFGNFLITISSFAMLCVVTYYVFVAGKQIRAVVGVNGLKLLTKMMGLILMVIGIQMLIDGSYGVVHDFLNNKYF